MKRVTSDVVKDVKKSIPNGPAPSMLSSHVDMRGHMIILKKILITCTKDKIKNLLVLSLKRGVWLAFGGIDAVNMQFANKSVHVGHIELVLIPDESQHEHRYGDVMATVVGHLVSEYNEVMQMLASSENADKTKNLLKFTNSECEKNGQFFTVTEYENRTTINFRCLGFDQPVVELRVLSHEKLQPLKKYKFYHLTTSQIWEDAKKNLVEFGENDWKHRVDNLTKALHRDELTFSFATMDTILGICFPAITVKQMMSRQAGLNIFEKSLKNAPEIFSSEQEKLLQTVKREIDDEADSVIRRSSFEQFVQRGRILGILPNDSEFMKCIDNIFNRNLLSQICNKVASMS